MTATRLTRKLKKISVFGTWKLNRLEFRYARPEIANSLSVVDTPTPIDIIGSSEWRLVGGA